MAFVCDFELFCFWSWVERGWGGWNERRPKGFVVLLGWMGEEVVFANLRFAVLGSVRRRRVRRSRMRSFVMRSRRSWMMDRMIRV